LKFAGVSLPGVAKTIAVKEAVQRLSTKFLMDPKFQGLHTRLKDAVLSGSTKNQANIMTVIKTLLKKEDPELYKEFEDLELE